MARIAAVLAAAVFATTGCSDPEKEIGLTAEELMDPESCKSCHPQHYIEWAGSMHAYAGDDPVFLAMNARGQRETGGELGDFCVGCHAPIAVRTGATTDGLNLGELPQYLKGVTCFFCHSVDAVLGDHNNPLRLSDDGVMRGGIGDPMEHSAHRSIYSPLHDRNDIRSSGLCGSCHDIVTPAGVHLERTFAEWKDSVFGGGEPKSQLSCSRCHMVGDVGGLVADVEGAPLRFPHEHSFPGVDVALIPWPGKDLQLAGIARDLFGAVKAELCVVPGTAVEIGYTLDNVFGGHMLPSGAAQDRRMWVEIVAYSGGTVVYQSGVVLDGEPIASLEDSDLWQLRDFTFDENGDAAHMFWDVASVESQLLPPAVTSDRSDPRFLHAVNRLYDVGVVPDRVTARVRIRPIGLDVLDDLTESGDLAADIRGVMPTFTLEGTVLEWSMADNGFGCLD